MTNHLLNTMFIPDLTTVIANDNRDRDIAQCFQTAHPLRNLLIAPLLTVIRRDESLGDNFDRLASSAYLAVRLIDMLLKHHPEETLKDFAQHLGRYRSLINEVRNNELKSLAKIPHVFDVIGHYGFTVYSPMDYLHLLLKDHQLQVAKPLIDVFRTVCILSTLSFELQRYHPAQVALAILSLSKTLNRQQIKRYPALIDKNWSSCRYYVQQCMQNYESYLKLIDMKFNARIVTGLRQLAGIKRCLKSEYTPPQSENFDEYRSCELSLSKKIEENEGHKLMGSGSYGQVYSVAYAEFLPKDADTSSCEIIAVKCFNDEHEALKELDAGARLTSMNICHALDTVRVVGPCSNRYLLYPLAMCSLNQYIVHMRLSHIKMAPNLIQSYTRQLLAAVKYLHERGIAHGDVKSTNVLLYKTGRLELCDLGTTRIIRPEDHLPSFADFTTYAVTPPEQFYDNFYHPFTTDIWGIGCILYEMFMMEHFIMSSDTDLGTLSAIIMRKAQQIDSDGLSALLVSDAKIINEEFGKRVDGEQSEPLVIVDEIPEDGLELLSMLLQPKPARRATIQTACEHRYITTTKS